jgi:hypothetical protein
VNKSKLLKRASLVAMAAMLPLSQVATAGEVNISGWVNEELFAYDDGTSSDIIAAEANGITLGTRLQFAGTQELPNSGMTAGFEFSVEPGGLTPLLSITQATGGDNNTAFTSVNLLSSSVNIAGGFGKLTLGTQSMPTDNIAVLSDPSLTLWSGVSPVFRGNGLTITGLGATAANTTWASNLQCVTTPGLGIGFDCNGVYRTGLRYDLPAFMGVKIAVGYANDDIYDISLNHSGSIAGLNTVIGMGYAINQGGAGSNLADGTNESEVFQVQGGLMDPGTGIFGSVAYMNDEGDGGTGTTGTGGITGGDVDSYFIKVGVKRAFNSLGDTAIAFKYGSYNDAMGAGDVGMTGSEVERLGVELVQYFGAGFQIYGTWEQLDLDVDCGGTTAQAATCTTNYGGADEVDMFALGATYFF